MPTQKQIANTAHFYGVKVARNCAGQFVVLDMPKDSWLYGAYFDRRSRALAAAVAWHNERVGREAIERAFARDKERQQSKVSP